MRIVGAIALVIILAIGGGFAWCSYTYPTYTYRYRMTVEVEAAGQLRTGSSVIEVRQTQQPTFGSAPPVAHKVTGEAVFVDLGGGRNVIALLASGARGENVDYPFQIAGGLFALYGAKREDLAKYAALQGPSPVPANRLPTLVTFSDLNDSATARVIKPDEFEQVFGPDVHFKRVWIEITDAPVTRAIEQKMPILIAQLRERAKIMQVKMFGGHFVPELGYFYVGDR